MSKPFVSGHDIQPAAPGWSRPAFWRALALTWAITLGFAAILNVIVDPFGIYGTGIFPRAQVNNYEEKLKLFDEFQPPPQALILGSSRVMSLDPETVTRLTGKRCFNFSLPGAKTETYYAVLKLALEHGAPIDTLIIGVEPEAFHPTLQIEPEARFVPEYSKHFIYDPHGQAAFSEKLSLILTLDQTSESISSLTRLFKSKAGQSKLEYRPDGFSVQIEREDEITAGTFNLNARIDSRVRKYPERSFALSEFKGLSERREQYWTDLLDLCHEHGIKLYVVMPPAHPRLIQLLDELGAGPIFKEVADYLSSTVGEAGGSPRLHADRIVRRRSQPFLR